MANSIRTPRQGVTASSRRIAQAVDDEEWQKFRVSLKGKPTWVKLEKLRQYWHGNLHGHVVREPRDYADCDFCIRVDNYIKALCRGGQLQSGESLMTALDQSWNLYIKK
jgi:hypothetical protein